MVKQRYKWTDYNISALLTQMGEVNTKLLASQYGLTERKIKVAIKVFKKYYKL